MGLPANKWYVKKAVLQQCVEGCSNVQDCGWMLYSRLMARHRMGHNRVRMDVLPRKSR